MRLAMQRGMRAKLTEHGYDVASLADDQMTDDFHYFIFPNITINTFAERFSIFRYMPHLDDPARSTFWVRSEEHTSDLQSLMRLSYAFFCLKTHIPTPSHTLSTIHPTSLLIVPITPILPSQT